ncbi:hypothetical protein [Gelidibacter gilvus]|uniref:Uncharacterized protein n=1 Tax=Gelidibacter gilvus TaxID=59602 RepID=A0A4V1LN79_9FLAO|nr:hypothetical protein [Gelidibacter gilvus]RXJ51346.1 hypothetical protein ESZ48_05625 [Gelidibacter gilvus]
MKNSLLLLALISIVCLSCDGRQTKKEALDRAISEFNLKHTVSEMVNYHPEAYVEIVTDTLISNGIHVHIKNYSLLDEQILISHTTDVTSKEVKYQRVFESEIIVSNASKDILSTHISAKDFKSMNTDVFWDDATLQHVWVNQDLSTEGDIKLDISFINPKNNAYKLYRMSIDGYGQQTLNLIEEHS